jgi:hypothetical protein
MPIVVRELVIRARVEEAASGPRGNGSTRVKGERMRDADLRHLVALCAEKMMENIERRKER